MDFRIRLRKTIVSVIIFIGWPFLFLRMSCPINAQDCGFEISNILSLNMNVYLSGLILGVTTYLVWSFLQRDPEGKNELLTIFKKTNNKNTQQKQKIELNKKR